MSQSLGNNRDRSQTIHLPLQGSWTGYSYSRVFPKYEISFDCIKWRRHIINNISGNDIDNSRHTDIKVSEAPNHLKWRFHDIPPWWSSKLRKRAKVSSLIMSIIGHTATFGLVLIRYRSGWSQPSVVSQCASKNVKTSHNNIEFIKIITQLWLNKKIPVASRAPISLALTKPILFSDRKTITLVAKTLTWSSNGFFKKA
jgi:hypothetical protein